LAVNVQRTTQASRDGGGASEQVLRNLLVITEGWIGRTRIQEDDE
jgi:hypothetical protein